jgi:DNA-binding PadR family transcriptional regulator
MDPIHVALTPTAYAILGLLREQPMHGYEIAQHFKPEADLGQVVPADMSTIYTFLKDLQEHGLISGKRETVGARPPRTVFSPTPEAEDLFLDWVHRPVARIREVRLDFLLKLYFAQRLGAKGAKALVDAQIVVCRSYLSRQKASVRALVPSSFESLVLESKLTAAESTLNWLKRIAAQVAPQKRSRIKAKRQSAGD